MKVKTVKTFAEQVAAFLDQYRASKSSGQFISVDPDNDGDKQVIFVTDDGEVNPDASNSGKWKNFVPGVKTPIKKQSKDSPGQLGTHEDPFTGKFRRKPEVQQRLKEEKRKPKISAIKKVDIGLQPYEKIEARTNKDGSKRANSKPKLRQSDDVKKVARFNKETKKFEKLDKQGKVIQRRKRGTFEDAAISYAFEEGFEASKEDIAAVKQIAKQVQKDINERGEEIVQAMRSLFSNKTGGLSSWQAKARAANDIKDLEAAGIDQIIAGQTYSDSETNLLPIIRAHAGYLMDGGDQDEEAVFEALRKPLPKPLPLNDQEIVERAGAIYAEQRETTNEMSREFDPGFLQLLEKKDQAIRQDDWDLASQIEKQMESQYTDSFNKFYEVDEAVEDESVPFAAVSFSDAVERYASQMGLFGNSYKSQKQGKLFGGDGKTWKDQPRVPKGNKDGGQWTEGSSGLKQITPAMQEARKKLIERTDRPSSREQRRTLKQTQQRAEREKKPGAKKTYELTQQQYIVQEVTKLVDKRNALLQLKGEIGDEIRKAKKQAETDLFQFNFYNLQELLEKDQKARKSLGWLASEKNGGRGSADTMHYASNLAHNLLWLKHDIGDDSSWSEVLSTLPFEAVDRLISTHRSAVRKAVKNSEEIADENYKMYGDADWIPGNEGKKLSNKGAKQFIDDWEKEKKTDAYRVRASLGRKWKKSASDQIEPFRKKLLRSVKKLGEENEKVWKEYADSKAERQKVCPQRKDFENKNVFYAALDAWMDENERIDQEYKSRTRSTKELFIGMIETMPKKQLRAKGVFVDMDDSSMLEKDRQVIESAIAWMEKVSGGSLPNIKSFARYTKNRRSYGSMAGISISKSSMGQRVIVHELGHVLEFQSELGNKSVDFLYECQRKEKTRWIGGGCKPDEVGAKDGLYDKYSGKFYGSYASEVLSMGMQELLLDPVRFAEVAPDHFNYTIAAMRGLL
ncbi:MAG: hypothetical protein ACO23H_03170 [Alphaproteobacteria bacterium]